VDNRALISRINRNKINDSPALEMFDVQVIAEGKRSKKSLAVVSEEPVSLVINGRELLTMLCTPENIEELAAGFLWNEGLVQSPDDILSLDVSSSKRVLISLRNKKIDADFRNLKLSFTSGCGRGAVLHDSSNHRRIKPKEFDAVFPEAIFHDRMLELLQHAKLYNSAGSIHCTGLADKNNLIFAFEDIGRHNAADKVIGKIFLDRIDVSERMMLTTGRMSSEIVGKAARAGVPILASISGPTSLAVEAACYYNITLIGYLRGTGFRVYAHGERIT